MLDKEFFKMVYMGLLSSKGVTMEQKGLQFTYEVMKNDFENEEFEAIAFDVFKNENFYGKAPDPALFYKRKCADAPSKKENEKQAFLDKCSEYLNSGFVSSALKARFEKSLTNSEMKALSRVGGISACWSTVNRNGAWDGDKMSWKMKELSQAFDVSYTEQSNVPMIADHSNDNGEELIEFNIDDILRLKGIPA